jgi:VanZ family protein
VVGGWTMILIVVMTCLLPAPQIEPVAELLPDKAEHALAFFGLTLWFSGLYPRRHWWKLALLFVLLGALIEVAQGVFTTTRAMEFNDAVADTVGILLALAAARAGADRWCSFAESFLPPGR